MKAATNTCPLKISHKFHKMSFTGPPHSQKQMQKFFHFHRPTKNPGENATTKDFFNQFLDDDYLDLIVCYAMVYAHSQGDNNLMRKRFKITKWNSDNPYMNLQTFLFICFLLLSVESFLNCCKMHSFHRSEDHVQITYRERTRVQGLIRQIILLGALQA